MKIALFGAHGRVGQAFLRFVQVDERYMVRSLIRTNREEMLGVCFKSPAIQEIEKMCLRQSKEQILL